MASTKIPAGSGTSSETNLRESWAANPSHFPEMLRRVAYAQDTQLHTQPQPGAPVPQPQFIQLPPSHFQPQP